MKKFANAIEFNDYSDKYKCFLNNYRTILLIDNKCYPTVDNFFYSKMFENIDPEFSEQLRLSDDEDIREITKSREKEVGDEWFSKRLNVLYQAIKQKFTTNDDLKAILLSTGDSYLLYDNKDSFLGSGRSGSAGCNILGKVLMEVRNELRSV
jgi:ribA/ribD-fused uncharacterized protein